MHDPTTYSTPVRDEASKILNILSFVCPPIGLVIYLSLIGKMPRQALSAGFSAAKGLAVLIGLFLTVVSAMITLWFVDDVLRWTQPPVGPSPATTAPFGVPPTSPVKPPAP